MPEKSGFFFVKDKPVAAWLFACAAAVFLMAIIGAITRLTESGLSIVEWKPVSGALPPLNEADWMHQFDLYKQSPQYLKVNTGMSLEEFKKIFFWEWIHRLWGRMIGMVYLLPLLFFWKRLPVAARSLFAGVLALGALQGLMGWVMVKSGLVDNPAVSHYRLAAHLMLAFLIYGCLLRLGFSFSLKPQVEAERLTTARGLLRGVLAMAVLTMIWGAFVAGLDAGMVYNTFPLMNGHVVPPELSAHAPVWMAIFEEPASVQFTHRVLALLTAAKALALVFKGLRLQAAGRARKLLQALGVAVLAQVSLGVATLLSVVDLHLATLHQAGAITVLTLLVWLLHEIPSQRSSAQ